MERCQGKKMAEGKDEKKLQDYWYGRRKGKERQDNKQEDWKKGKAVTERKDRILQVMRKERWNVRKGK